MTAAGPLRPGFWRTPLIIAGCIGVLGAVVAITIALQNRLAAPPGPVMQVSPPLPSTGSGRPAEPALPDPPGSPLARAEAAEVIQGMASLRGRWLQGYRLAGAPMLLAGHAWMGGAQSAIHGVRIVSGSIAPGIPGGPSDSDSTQFLGSGLTGPGALVRLSVPIQPGPARLSLWLASTLPISAASLQVRVDARMVPRVATSAHGPNWCCLGPFEVQSDHARLELEVGNLGRAVLCGLALTAP